MLGTLKIIVFMSGTWKRLVYVKEYVKQIILCLTVRTDYNLSKRNLAKWLTRFKQIKRYNTQEDR